MRILWIPRGALARQLLRGALGFGWIGAGLALSVVVGPAALLLLPVGLLALRGCPACWLVGLLSIVGGRRAAHLGCADGSCARAGRDTAISGGTSQFAGAQAVRESE